MSASQTTTAAAPASTPVSVKKVGKYLIGEKIGSGSFSTVHIAVDTQTKERVAVKVCCNATYRSKKMFEDLENEILTLRKGQGCKHVMGLKGEMQTQNNTYIVMELCETTLLEEVMTAGSFDLLRAKLRFRELIGGVKHLHDEGIVHRDIKPENIMIGQEGMSKVGDFGFARPANDKTTTVGAGTAEYLPPEAFLSNRMPKSADSYDFMASDMWSCGVVLYAMLTGRLPYSREQVKAWRKLSDVRMPEFPASMDPVALDLIKSLLSATAADRPTAACLFNKHPFLKSPSPISRKVKTLGKQLSRVMKGVKQTL